jgi:2-polyprenyl-3-methyl-5-hydroxy-6-metoxy-1,4-benzoquinol methylase
VSANEQAYRSQLQRQQAHESDAKQLEGYRVWFDDAVFSSVAPALDYGAGRGQGVRYLRQRGFREVEAYEPNAALADELRTVADAVHTDDAAAFLRTHQGRYGLILCKDVLEHLDRDETLTVARGLLNGLVPGGRLVVSVPHAVSFVGQTWRYGDFTHRTTFTAGSLRFVLEAAGASRVQFHAPSFPLRASPRTLAYRALKSCWHMALRAIYTLEDPGSVPPHFHPRLVATAAP